MNALEQLKEIPKQPAIVPPLVDSEDINDHTQAALDRIQEILPVMANAVGLSAKDNFGAAKVVDCGLMDAEIEIGEHLLVILQFEQRNQGILDTPVVAISEVEVMSVHLAGGGYWEPPETQERTIYKGPSLMDGLMRIVMQEHMDAIDGAVESHEEQKAHESAEAMYDETFEEFGVCPR